METDVVTISDALKEAVRRDGRTPYRICKEAGVCRISLSRFLRGKAALSTRTADQIARVVGVELRKRESAAAGL